MPGKTTPATGPPRRGCQSVRPALSTAAATGDTAADSGHRFRAGTPCGNMPPGHPQPGNPPRFRADSLSNGHPGNRGKRPPHPCHPAGQDAAGPGRFPARHRQTPGHRAALVASVSAGKPPPGGARCRARPPPPPGHPCGLSISRKATAGRGKIPGKTTTATGPPRRGCQSVRATLSTTAATGDTAAGNPQPGNPPRFRADSLSNGHPGRRGKRPPPPGHPAGQDAAGPGRFPARHRHTPGHRATLAASVSAGKPPPGGARYRARPPPPPGTPPPETLSRPPGAVSPGQQRPPIPAGLSVSAPPPPGYARRRFRPPIPGRNTLREYATGPPSAGKPAPIRADSLSIGHPGRRGKRPPQPGQPAGQDAAGPGRFHARHRHTPGHRATLAASVSAGKPPPGGARCRARPPPPPGHPAGAVSQSGPPSAPPPPPGTPPPETLSSPPGAVSPGQQRPPIPATRDSLNRGKTAGRPASTRPKKRKNRPPPHKTGPPSAAKTCLTH